MLLNIWSLGFISVCLNNFLNWNNFYVFTYFGLFFFLCFLSLWNANSSENGSTMCLLLLSVAPVLILNVYYQHQNKSHHRLVQSDFDTDN